MFVSIKSKKIHLGLIVAAARQDVDHTTGPLETACVVHGANAHGAVPWRIKSNGDTATANAYRAILRDLLPGLRESMDAAYAKYVSVSVSTPRRADGHGSWVSGPSPALQNKWLSLADAVAETEAAIAEANNA